MLQICIIVIEIISKGNVTFSSFSINWFRIVTVSSSDRWLDYLFTKPSFNSEGSETKRLRLFRPLFHKLRIETRAIAFSPAKPVCCMHKIMLDCTLLVVIGKEPRKRLKSELFPSRSYTCTHVRTSLQQKRKHSWLCRRVGSCRKEPNCGLGWDVWKTYHAKSSLFPACLESWCTRLAPGYSNLSSFEDLVTKFEFRGTVNLHLHGTVCVIIKFLYPNSLIIAYFLSLYEKIVARAA